MITLQGEYNIAKVFTNNIENEAISQIIELLNQPFIKDCKVRIMPDVHKGAGCVIGFSADLGDKVIPNLVGVDIGCGMLTVKLGQIDIDLKELDDVIYKYVPSGHDVHENKTIQYGGLQDLYCYRNLKDTKRIEHSIGTLGGGNHFLEVDIDEQNNKYLVIHSGSRNLGHQVATYYQNLAIELCSGKEEYFAKRDEIIKTYKEYGKKEEIQSALMNLKEKYKKLQPKYPRDLCFLTGKYRDMYLHDMKVCQGYAKLNRQTIANILLDKIFNKTLKCFNSFHTTHNYIDFKDNIIRKGCISAYKNEKVLIPINMRDGSILAIGKGNSDWNYSAPHGAGRLMSRSKAKESINLDEFKKCMSGIYTTSVNLSTIDEAPGAYKSIEEIIESIQDTVEIISIIKPIYNFKASN